MGFKNLPADTNNLSISSPIRGSWEGSILPLKDKLFRMALRITMQREEAEDIVQETMIKLWNQRDNLENIESVEGYAMTICRNLALDHLRKASHNTVSLDALPSTDAHPAVNSVSHGYTNPYDKIFAEEGIRRINRIMAEMPEKHRTCMQLRDFEGKNYKEIADILSITEDQVKVNIFRARKYIKEKIQGINLSS